jgi:hypothetical protein
MQDVPCECLFAAVLLCPWEILFLILCTLLSRIVLNAVLIAKRSFFAHAEHDLLS